MKIWSTVGDIAEIAMIQINILFVIGETEFIRSYENIVGSFCTSHSDFMRKRLNNLS